MRIGILTLHSNTNFGGGLQQIAMFEILKGLGHEPRFLCVKDNSRISAQKRLIGILTSYSTRQIMDSIKEAIHRAIRKSTEITPNTLLYEKTDKFNYKTLNYTPKFPLEQLPKYSDECDALIFGSDQIWTDVYSPVLPYFGGGMPSFKGKKIAYAACSAHNKVPLYNRQKIKGLLQDFDAISVRDETTRQLVNSIIGMSPKIVCDPTLLYDFKKFYKQSPIKVEYIFAYVLGDKAAEWHQININKIKEVTGISQVVALTTSLDDNFPWADIVITDALAIDWMNLLRESAFVYTNSFHAVIFSLKFHKQFVAYYGDLVRSSRMISLREQFNLKNRIVKDPQNIEYNKEIDFNNTDVLIASIAKQSSEFLKNILD